MCRKDEEVERRKKREAKQEETSMSSTTHTQTKLENSFLGLFFLLSLI